MAQGFDDFQESFTRGDTHAFQFTVKLGSVAQDITAWTKFWITVKKRVNDPDANAILHYTDAPIGGGITRSDPTNGVCTVIIRPADTALLIGMSQPLSFYMDFQGVDAGGNVYTLAKGILQIFPDVTVAIV